MIWKECKSSWSSKFKIQGKFSGSFPKGKPRKKWDEVIRKDLKGKSARTKLKIQMLASLS